MSAESEVFTNIRSQFINDIQIIQKSLEKDPLIARRLLKQHKEAIVKFIDKLILDDLVKNRGNSLRRKKALERWADPDFRARMTEVQRARRVREEAGGTLQMYLVNSNEFGESELKGVEATKLLRVTRAALDAAISRGNGKAVYRGNFFNADIESLVTVVKVVKSTKEPIPLIKKKGK